MTTTPDELRSLALDVADEHDNLVDVASALAVAHAALIAAADAFPVVAPPTMPPRLPDVRHVFDHGGEWGTRSEWQAALNRAPMRRSRWTVASSVEAQRKWVETFVNDVMADTTNTVYIVGVSPFPASEYDPTTLKAHYAAIGNQLARLNAQQRARVFLRFGWEPNGDWYPHSFSPKGGILEPARVQRYIDAWAAFSLAMPTGIRLVLNFSGEGARKDPGLFQRVAESVTPDVVSVDVYPMWDNRVSWAVQQDCFSVARAVAQHLDVPWAVDEWSPFVDKVVGGVQRGNLDGKVAVDSMNGAYHYVQQARLDDNPPLWVQMFERVSAEGKFAVVSVQAGAVTTANTYRSAGGALRSSYAPRVAQVLVSLLGNPA